MPSSSLVKHNLKIIKTYSTKNNFGLSQEEFDIYLNKTKMGDESFFVLLSQVHFGPCKSFLKVKFKISESEAYDICMDTMLKFRTKLLNDKITYGNLNYLYTRMASNIYLDSKKRIDRIEDALGYFTTDNTENKMNENEFLDILEVAMKNMDSENQELLNQLYYEEKDILLVAKERNISYPALRKRKQRMLVKLKSKFKEQLNKS